MLERLVRYAQFPSATARAGDSCVRPASAEVARPRRRRSWSRPAGLGVALATWLLLLASVHPALAQQVHGRLLDLESDGPLVAGLLTLLTADGVRIITAVSDDEGYWLLEVPEPGIYYIEAKRIGYQAWVAGPLEVKRDDDLDSVYRLRRFPVMLDAFEVSAAATRRYLTLSGFYDRQRADFGHYITPEDIEKRQATAVTDLLRSIPGVNLVSLTDGSVGPRSVQLRGSNLSHGGVCRPRVFVDGIMYARGDSRPKRLGDPLDVEQLVEDQLQRVDQGLSLDDIGHPSSIAAIEVYRSSSQVPVQFGGTSVETQCGVIVIWTRTGRMRSGQ